jgi:hypothetical protein
MQKTGQSLSLGRSIDLIRQSRWKYRKNGENKEIIIVLGG